MGETFEEMVNLIICDIFQSILDRINKGNINTLKAIKLFSIAMKSNEFDVNIIGIISEHLKLIFGLKEKDSFEFVFNLFNDEKIYTLNFKLIDLLRKSEIILVKL